MSTIIDAAPAGVSEIVCPECSSELQVTASIWLSVLPDGRIVPAFGGENDISDEMKWYCSSDHDTSGVAFAQGLYDKVVSYLEERMR